MPSSLALTLVRRRAAYNSMIETLAAAASQAASLTKRITLWAIDGSDTLTLAAGTFRGQQKLIVCTAAANTPAGTITPTGLRGATNVTFNAVGDTVLLEWDGANWNIVGGNSYGVS